MNTLNRTPLSNEGCYTQAKIALNQGRFTDAIKWLNSARAKTIGHKKRDRYERQADTIAREFSVDRTYDMATDCEVYQ